MAQSTHQRRLSGILRFRSPKDRFLVWFCARKAPFLVLHPATDEGAQEHATQLARITERDPAAQRELKGELQVDSEHRLVFVAPEASARFLAAFAGWVAQVIDEVPALAAFGGAGVQLEDGSIYREEALWEALAPKPETLAALLATAVPGENLWYHLDLGAPMPINLFPLAQDPLMERLQTALTASFDPTAVRVGRGVVEPDGRLHLFGADLDATLTSAVAAWVRAHHAEHPALARLKGLRVSLGPGTYAIEAAPSSWEGVPDAVVPGTPAEVAAVLSSGEDAWFWLGTEGSGAPVLSLAPVSLDPTGRRFAARAALLEQGEADGARGMLTRAGNRLLFASDELDCNKGRAHLQSFLEAHRGNTKALDALAGAGLVQLRGTQVAAAATAS